MTIKQLFENYLEFLWQTFMYDMDVYSQGWMWYLLLIPAFVYSLFFMVKWVVLLIPFHFPILIICRTIIEICKKPEILKEGKPIDHPKK